MSREWKVGIVYDTATKTRGHHGTHLSFTGLPGLELILADSNVADLESRMRAINAVRHYIDPLEMMAREQPDIVVICSRLPAGHFELIQAAGKQGCHVLCEKPLAASLEEADAMVALAESQKIKIAVAHLARHALVFRNMKRMIRNGAIGTPLTFYGRGKEDERGGGEDMLVLGTHILDLGVFLFGKPEQIIADVRMDGRPITAKSRSTTTEPVGICAGDSVWATLRFPDRVNGVFETRRGLYTGTVRMGVTVAGTEGTLSVRYDQARALRFSRSSLPPEDEAHYSCVELHEDRSLPDGTEPIDYESYEAKPAHFFADANRFAAFDLMQAIQEDRQPVCSVHDAATALEMIYGTYASSLEQKGIELPLNNRKHPLGRGQLTVGVSSPATLPEHSGRQTGGLGAWRLGYLVAE